jgi:hypothetical protein
VTTPKECRLNARRCEALAHETQDRAARALLLGLAEEWRELLKVIMRLPTIH